jgi:hypothetical protein
VRYLLQQEVFHTEIAEENEPHFIPTTLFHKPFSFEEGKQE